MEFLKDLFKGKGYIESISIINTEGEYLFNSKFNKKLGTREPQYDIVGKNYFEIIQNLDENTSSVYNAMRYSLPVYVENQLVKCKDREDVTLNSLSVPIKSAGRIVGAIDLSVKSRDADKIPDNDLDTGCGTLSILENSIQKSTVDKLHKATSEAVYTADDIITNNSKMLALKNYISTVAGCDIPVLIFGETGTGKELFAQSIHNMSNRSKKPFIAKNCASIPDNLLETILFGTAKGAFTGAVDNKGLLEIANKGTLFLDEINLMPLHLQAKLLRVLQDGRFRSVGAKELKHVDLKIIAALNKEPLKAIEQGQLRKDIYYRLSIMSMHIPPLRDRKDDLQILFEFFIKKYAKILNNTNIARVSGQIYKRLKNYDWPGNIRELEHIVVYGLSHAQKEDTVLEYRHIEEKFNEFLQINTNREVELGSLEKSMKSYEKKLIMKALKTSDYNISKASKLLKVPRTTFFRKAQKHNLV